MLDRLNLSLGGVVLRQIREFWWVYLLAVTAMFFTHRFQVELPFIAQELGELVISNQLGEIPYATYFLIALGIIFFRTSSRALFFWPARILQGSLQEELTMRLEQGPPWRYQSYSSGQIYQHLVTDMMNMRGFIGFGLLQVGNVIIAMSVLIPRLVDFNQASFDCFSSLGGLHVDILCGDFFHSKILSQNDRHSGRCAKFYYRDLRGKKKPLKTFNLNSHSCSCLSRDVSRSCGPFFKGPWGLPSQFP